MNVPKLRFSKYNEEWNKIDLANIFSYFSTNSLSREQLSFKGDIKNLHYGDIHKKFGALVDVSNDINTFIKDQNFNNKYELCKENDLVIADASEDYEGIGKATEVINIRDNKIISGLHTIMARDNKSVFSPKFKGYYFNSPAIHNQIRVLANGFKVFGISKDTINSLNAYIPSKEEQKNIADMLQLLDKKIELQSQKIEVLKLYKKGLIIRLKISKSKWKEYKIADIFNITRGIVIPKIDLSDEHKNDYIYPVYSSQTSNNGILGYDKTYDFDGKYLTWTTDGANAGKVFFRDGKFRCTNVCGILYNDNNLYVDELTAELLKLETPKHVSYVGNPKLMNNVMSNIKISLPNKNESENISFILKKINTKVDLEIYKLDKLQDLKKGLIQNMFV